MNAYTDAVGRLDPILNEPYQMLKDMPEVLAWKGMGAAAGGFVGIISKDPEATKAEIPWKVLEWEIDTEGLVLSE